jgi:hypothetical protein
MYLLEAMWRTGLQSKGGEEVVARFIFTDKAQFGTWVNVHCDPHRYEFYISKTNEVLAYPTKTSRPINYGYIKFPDKKEVDSFIEALKAAGQSFYLVDKIQWDDTKPVEVQASA